MIEKIDYKKCRQDYPKFPFADNRNQIFTLPKILGSHILSISSSSAKGHAKNLSQELDKMLGLFELEALIFLGDSKRAWRYQEQPYRPVQNALAYLKQNKVSKRFDGVWRKDG